MSTPSSVPHRKLGKYGPSIPALGFGLMGMSGAYGSAPTDEERFKVLDRAVEIGETFWDTSDMYGDNEDMLGRWFKLTGKRDQIFLASKFAVQFDRAAATITVNSSAEYCKKACQKSLDRMGIATIDLYYCHRVNHDVPIEETMRALAELKAEGKIKYIGLSEVSSTTLRRACKIAHVDAVQMEYSPFVLDIERDTGTNILQACRELGVAMVCYSPLGRGLLTGAYMTKESVSADNDTRAWYPRFSGENFEANVKLVSQFKALADKKKCTPGQLAIAWCLKQGDDFFPIPGTKKIKYLEENWGSLDVNLTNEEEAEIRKFVEGAEIKGHRAASLAIEFIYGDTKEEA